ncbi:hypothetical protein BB558_000004 [Smittium angustum]|uniref:Oxidation resistance protein 1 n=1 Tax=Smittium angustum TaxID=133377 RepID=A0A2U1JFM3_SMIAN|nr:hypothetical protein BB558_000004 [Smittium angustum]
MKPWKRFSEKTIPSNNDVPESEEHPDENSKDLKDTKLYKRLSRRRTFDFSRKITLNGRKPDTPSVITPDIASLINLHLPPRFKVENNWNLVYSLDQHGISLKSLLKSSEGKGPQVIAIKDTNGCIFGAFINENLRLNPNFYGNGTCFLWKIVQGCSDESIEQKENIIVYPHTKKSDYFILCDPEFIAIGGGEGAFGLWIHGDLLNGRSTRCPTFDNDPLCSFGNSENFSEETKSEIVTDANFKIQSIEIWAFQ